MKFHSSLDKTAISILVLLAGLFGLVVFFASQAGIRVTTDLPESAEIGPFQTIKLTFSEPVDFELASSVVSMDPIVDGNLEWVDSRTMQFVPIRPFELDTVYKLMLSPDVLTTTGRELKKTQAWEFTVREPLVVYMVADDTQSSLWGVKINDGPAQRITPETIKVFSFDTSRDGEFIIFSSVNEQNGIDLWRVSRNGSDAAILLDCERDRCTTPIISPDGKQIAYSREAAGPVPEIPFGSPRIWVVDLQNGKNSPVYEDQQIIGYGPSWSPDSTKLAAYDGLADQIRLIDFTNNKQYIFPSGTGAPVTWSSDSTKLLYTDVEQKEDGGLRTQVRLADLSLNDSTILLGKNDERDYWYYSLAWSPVEDMLLVGFRLSDEVPGQVLWLLDPGILEGIIIANQPDYTYNSPRWDPWGKGIVFQQFKLRTTFNPEIGLWRPGFSEPLILAQGIMPHWLP